MNFGSKNFERFLFNDEPEDTGGGFDFEALAQKADELDKTEDETPAEEPEVPSEEPVEAPAEEPEVPVEGEELPAEENSPEGFAPDLSFKALDQEHKMPEWLASSITSKEQEEQLREVFQKAEGLAHIKSKNEHLKGQIEQIQPQFEEANSTLSYLDHLVNAKDLDNIQKMARLSDDDILNHAAKILQKQELTPEQQQAYNNEIENRNSQYFTTQENATLRDNQYQQYVQSQEQILDQTLNTDAIKPYVDFFNGKVGETSNFKREVIEYAAKIQNDTQGKTILTVDQAVQGFLQQRVKPFYQEPTTATDKTVESEVPATEPQNSVTPPVDPREKQVMPTVRGGASKSPAKPIFNSIADIVKYREQHFETE